MPLPKADLSEQLPLPVIQMGLNLDSWVNGDLHLYYVITM